MKSTWKVVAKTRDSQRTERVTATNTWGAIKAFRKLHKKLWKRPGGVNYIRATRLSTTG